MTSTMRPRGRATASLPVAVGVDVAEERKGLDLVAIDAERRVVASQSRLAVGDLARLVLDDLQPVMVCIDSPSGWSTSGRSRLAERQLAQLRISAYPTGPDPGDHPFYRWMRVGMAVFAAVAGRYRLFQGVDPRGTAAEVFPHASAVVLAGRTRRPDETKVQFRRAVLQAQGVDDGLLPTLDRVDAALAALTGLSAIEGRWRYLGDPEEGVILLPTPPG